MWCSSVSVRKGKTFLKMVIKRRKCLLLTSACVLVLVLWKTESRFLKLLTFSADEKPDSEKLIVNPVRPKDLPSTSLPPLARREISQVSKQSKASEFISPPSSKREFQAEEEKGIADRPRLDRFRVDREHPEAREVRMPLYHDVFTHEDWPELEVRASTNLKSLPRTVHYLWCSGQKYFLFRHYLALLSAVRMFRPMTIFFHYSHLPQADHTLYNTWFQEMKHSLPHLQLVQSNVTQACGSQHLLAAAMTLLMEGGGLVMGEDVVLAGHPRGFEKVSFWWAFAKNTLDLSTGMMAASRGFGVSQAEVYRQEIEASQPGCVPADKFNLSQDSFRHCIVVTWDVYPRDLWHGNSSFAELARWIYYGQRTQLTATPGGGKRIPRVAHVIWLKANLSASLDLSFQHYLSLLSALHVGGLQHVYVHGNVQPEGAWWRALAAENVTFVKIDRPQTMFQQDMSNLQASSDFLRANLLTHFGGVYMDSDVIWTSKIPDWLLAYPAVASYDWPLWDPWPDSFNLGVFMARAHAPWLRHWQDALRFYNQQRSGFTAIYLPYRLLEHHPSQLLVYNRLQVICFRDICHPTWQEDFRRDIRDRSPTQPFEWREVLAAHVTQPKPPPAWTSPRALVTAGDMYGELGRYVLQQSGRSDLLE